MGAIREHRRREQQASLGVTVEVYRERPTGERGEWWRADFVVNGEIKSSAWANVRPGTNAEQARGEAVVKARHKFRPPINTRLD